MGLRNNTLRAAAFLLALGVTGCGEKTTAPVDTVAPAAVSDLRIQSVSRFKVDVSWQPGTEPDLTGYNVYRSEEGSEMVLVGTVSDASYEDHAVSKRTRYQYAVSALDSSENESARTSTGVVVVPSTAGGHNEYE